VGTTNILELYFYFVYLIKGIVLGRTLWVANTSFTRNKLPNLNLVSKTILFLRLFY